MGSVMDGQDEKNTGPKAGNQSEQALATQLERLDEVLNMYGPEQTCWPEAVRAEFTEQELVQPALARRMEEERAFAHLLNMDAAPSPTTALRASILASAPSALKAQTLHQAANSTYHTPKSTFRVRVQVLLETLWSDGANLIPAGALAVSIMGGVILGSTGLIGNFSATTDPTEELMTLAFADTQYSGDW